MAISTSSLGRSAPPSPRQQGNTKRSRSLPALPASHRRHTPTSSIISTSGSSRTQSRIPTPMTSRENSSSPPLKPGPKPSSGKASPNTRTSKIKGHENFPSEKAKGKSPLTSRAHSHSSSVLHISKSSLLLIRDTGEGYDFGLPIGHKLANLSSQYIDIDKLDRMIKDQCKPLRNQLASVARDLANLKSHVAVLEANHKKTQKSDSRPESVAEPQTARQREKSPQKEFQPLTYASTIETAQVTQVAPESSKAGEIRNGTKEASCDVQDIIMKLRDENAKLRNENKVLEEKLRAYQSENVELIQAEEEVRVTTENEEFQPSNQQCETNAMDLDQEASGPSNPQGSGHNGDSGSQQGGSLPQRVSFEVIQRLSQEQEPFENVPDPDDMVTEVHTSQHNSKVQVQDSVPGNAPLIEASFMQHGPIITQQDIPPAKSYPSPIDPAQNTVEEPLNEIHRLGQTDNAYRKSEAVAVADTIGHHMKEGIQMTLEEVHNPTDVTAIVLRGKKAETIGTQNDTIV
ncbi:hypothetical protein F25303_4175 [Fusarium sp. NRRL 25303]|nr:hypothetical protein F25303_4175 [Fusarium sp. NRRL 25303]